MTTNLSINTVFILYFHHFCFSHSFIFIFSAFFLWNYPMLHLKSVSYCCIILKHLLNVIFMSFQFICWGERIGLVSMPTSLDISMCACVYMHIYTHLYLLPLQIHVVHSVRAKTTTAFLKQGPTVLLLLVGSHCPVLLISVHSLQ